MMKPFTLTKTIVNIGIAQPFQMLHITDTHICRADERDDLRKQQLAEKRANVFEPEDPGATEYYYRESVQFANEHHMLLVHTGDLFDFVSEQHCEMAKELLALPNDYFMAVGNHEFSLYVGEAFEDEAYKIQSYAKIQSAFPKYNLCFSSRVVNGVNLIAIDNVYYDFSAYQLDCLKKEAEKQLPILLFFHTPIYTPELYREVTKGNPTVPASAIGVPLELMQEYNDHRFRQQVTTPQTQKFLDYLYHLDLVKAIFAGHLHFSHESALSNGLMQYVTGAQYQNEARIIEIL